MAGLAGFRDRLKKALLVGAFFVAACQVHAASSCAPPGPLTQVQVANVIDGDTLALSDGRRVRLIGINAPELARDGRPAEPFARAARQRLQDLVAANGQRISLSVGQDPSDRYGRVLAHAFGGDGQSFEAVLIGAGLALHVAIAPNVALAGCLAEHEARARAGRSGLWQRLTAVPAADLRQPGFALVEVSVARVERNRGGLWLETDEDLVLHVPAKAMERFEVQALQAMVGRTVEVRGWVIERRQKRPGARWLMPLSHPSMLALQ